MLSFRDEFQLHQAALLQHAVVAYRGNTWNSRALFDGIDAQETLIFILFYYSSCAQVLKQAASNPKSSGLIFHLDKFSLGK